MPEIRGKKMLKITELKINGSSDPLGLDAPVIILSWKGESDTGHIQTAYHIRIKEGDRLVYDSRKILSSCQTDVFLSSFHQKSRTRYTAELVIYDEHDRRSLPFRSQFETGLMGEPFQASWIEPEQKEASDDESGPQYLAMLKSAGKHPLTENEIRPAQYLRKTFRISKEIRQARCYSSAHGVYSLYINGKKASRQLLAPESTAYEKRLFYQTCDITPLLCVGDNAVGVVLADGWYIGRIGLTGENHQYGSRLGFIGQIEIEYTDGDKDIIVSDASFRSSEGKIKYADLFLGECHDFNDDLKDFSLPSFDDSSWENVTETDGDKSVLTAQSRPPVEVIETLKPVRRITNEKSEIIYDFGKIIAGYAHVTAQGQKNSEIIIDYAEVLDSDQSYQFTVKGRHKNHQDKMILSGGEDDFLPEFTCHAFRYVRVSEEVDAIEAMAIGSRVSKSLSLETSNPDLNRIQDCIAQTQLTNMVSVLTDNPSREKTAFTGDNQLYAGTAFYNYDLSHFLADWLEDLRLEQCENGAIPDIIPYYPKMRQFQKMISGSSDHGRAGWGDGCIVIPYEHYRFYGQLSVLRDNYPAMVRWMDYAGSQTDKEGVWYGTSINDISHPHRQDGASYDYFRKKIDKQDKIIDISTIFSTVHYGYSAKLLSDISGELDRKEDRKKYRDIYETVKCSALKHFVKDGRSVVDVQSAYVYLLGMDMIDDSLLAENLADRLCTLIRENGNRHDLGFFGLRFLFKILFRYHREDLAYSVLLNPNCPSWMYMIRHGATTLWEHWDNISPDGDIRTESFTQCGAGCIGEAIYENILGLAPLEKGFREFRIRPGLGRNINRLRFSYESVYGQIRFSCEENGDSITFEVTVPFNTKAHVILNGCEYIFHSGTYSCEIVKQSKYA